ncbi:MAG: hypothetical protein ACREOO_00385 [bacterium]
MGKAMLLVALGLSSVMGRMLYNINARTLDLTETSYARHTRMVARNAAYSGAQIAVSELYRDLTWRTGVDTTFYNDGIFVAEAVDVTIDTPLAVSRVRITSIGSYNDVSDTVSVLVAQPAFSYYGLFSDSWPGGEYFDTGDSLYGPIHTNGQWNLTGNPVFFGKVNSNSNSFSVSGSPNPKFYGGYDLEVPAINLDLTFPAVIDSANAGGDVYASEVWLRFNADGTYDYGSDNTYSGGTKNLTDYNGSIMTTGSNDIHVEGTVNGQVTIYSGGDIFIEDVLVYSQDPRSIPGSQDVLGLIAQVDVIVVDNIANQTDCEIHAAIMALGNSFEVQNYSSGSPRGTLTVVGSVIQRDRGDLGTYSGGVLVTGYEPDWQYDRRYLNVGPPYFPLLPRAIVLAWEE